MKKNQKGSKIHPYSSSRYILAVKLYAFLHILFVSLYIFIGAYYKVELYKDI